MPFMYVRVVEPATKRSENKNIYLKTEMCTGNLLPMLLTLITYFLMLNYYVAVVTNITYESD